MRKILLIDIRLFLYQHYHRKESLLNVFKVLSALPIPQMNRVFFVFDDGKSFYHKKLYDEYKENRSERREAMSPEEKERYAEFSRQYKAIKEICRYFGTIISIPNTEADTMAEVLADTFLKQGNEVYIASGDGDFMCLLDRPNLYQVTPRGEVLDYQAVINKKGATPHQLFLSKCLASDVKDNILGLQGLGEIKDTKTGIKLKKIFQEVGDYWGEVVDTLQSQVDKGKLKLPENYPPNAPVKSVEDLYYFNYRLNEPYTYTMLTQEHQEELLKQTNTKKLLWDSDEVEMKIFEEFGVGLYIDDGVKRFYILKENK